MTTTRHRASRLERGERPETGAFEADEGGDVELPEKVYREHGEKLVLGFDAGCATCSGLAASIEEAADDKLEVLPLHDPLVESWRRRALGENAPWAPTLIEVKGGGIKAWTGVWLGVALGRRLGPATTWRVMQALGEARSAPGGATSPRGIGGISRGQFLKGIAGGALAFSIVPAASLGSAAQAAEGDDLRKLSQGSTAVRTLKGSRTVRLASRNFGAPDWDGVTKTVYKHDGVSRALFIVPLSANADRRGSDAGTFLVTEDDSRIDDAQALVIKSDTSQSGEVESLTWLEPDGTLVAATDIENDRLVAREASAGLSPTGRVQARGFTACFIRCLGFEAIPRCIGYCRFCTSPIGCAPCVACAGIRGIRCAISCRKR